MEPDDLLCSRNARPQKGGTGSHQTILHCAHRTSTVSSCAFCEQEGWSGGSLSHPSEAARCASTEDHQAPSPPLLRKQRTNAGIVSTSISLSAPATVEARCAISRRRRRGNICLLKRGLSLPGLEGNFGETTGTALQKLTAGTSKT